MHSSTAFLPLLAFAAGVLAAPTPSRPNLHEVIRNPTPIDAGLHLGLEGKLPLNLGALSPIDILVGHPRAAPDVKEDAAPVVVVDRS
jgi:hypothetical protein